MPKKDNALSTSTLRPGFLVSLKTTIHGNVKYAKLSLRDEVTPDGVSIVEWETTRTVFDPDEHNRATKVRQNARNKIADACINTGFGLLCPSDQRERLDEAVKAAREEVREFNKTAKLSLVRVYVIAGYIADSDEEALKAIASEVKDLMRGMEQGIQNMDATAIRDAASRALKVGQMLQPGASEQVKDAVKLAREVARKITKAGESAAQEVDTLAIKAISAKRTAFLDFGEQEEPINLKGTGRAVDMDAGAPVVAAPTKSRKKPRVEMEEVVVAADGQAIGSTKGKAKRVKLARAVELEA